AAAVPYFRQAMEYRLSLREPEPSQGTIHILRQTMGALLRSGQYDDAAGFARNMIAVDPTFRPQLGAEIVAEKDALVASRRRNDALALIAAVLKLEYRFLPQDDPYRTSLVEARQELQRGQ